jgi:hypothetical protein
MGLGFTIDTPHRVAHYGISSVISLVDDGLMEKMRKYFCEQLNLEYHPISHREPDFRAARITAYLDLMDEMVKEKFRELKQSVLHRKDEIEKYIALLPDISELKQKFETLIKSNSNGQSLLDWAERNLFSGSIDVNIMTKLDRHVFSGDEKLPPEFNDAHAALRGYAQSKLSSALVLSAGMNPRLYNYLETFEDFYPDQEGNLKKKIILKVSDYRSAIIQGKYLAKKGIWVSEYRIESGLNCGGHAFASDGYLMGPILAELSLKRESLQAETFEILSAALQRKGRPCPDQPLPMKFTAQGGVGTAEEHNFLLEYYKLDSIGWGSPFLLVPEVVSLDEDTMDLLCKAKEEDLYLSGISPLGVPFNNVRNNSKDLEKQALIDSGNPGSHCPKRYACILNEFGVDGICSASRKYQRLKIQELDTLAYSPEKRKREYEKIVEKACICLGLGTSALLEHGIDHSYEGAAVSVCPGPNLAYFDKKVSLKEMVDHIYGRTNIISRTDRPHMFLKELELYINYLQTQVEEADKPLSDKQEKYFEVFRNNILEGVQYYKGLFSNEAYFKGDRQQDIFARLSALEARLA